MARTRAPSSRQWRGPRRATRLPSSAAASRATRHRCATAPTATCRKTRPESRGNLRQRHLWTNPFRRDTLEARVLGTWRNTPLLHGIPSGVAQKLVALTHLRQYQPGEAVFREGDNAVAAAVIVSGHIIVRSHEQDIARLDPGDFFGEAA